MSSSSTPRVTGSISASTARTTAIEAVDATLLVLVPAAVVLCVADGTCTRVGAGELRVLVAPVQGGPTAPGAPEHLVFLACGAFSYPLVEQPALQSEERVFILPADAQRHFVVYIGADVPLDVVGSFKRVLADATQLRLRGDTATAAAPLPLARSAQATTAAATAATPRATGGTTSAALVTVGAPSGTSTGSHLSVAGIGEALSTAIVISGKLAALALVTGADVAGRGIEWSTSALISRLRPADPAAGTAAAALSPETLAHLQRAKVVSQIAVTVSAGLVAGAAQTARSLAAALTQAIMSTEMGQRLAESGETEAGRAVKLVAASGFVAFTDVWDGMERAAVTLGTHTAAGIHGVVEHSYGPEAGVAAQHTLTVAADVGQTALNLRNVGVGGILRRTAAETARTLVSAPPTPGGGDGTGLRSAPGSPAAMIAI